MIFITAYPERLLTGKKPEPTYLIPKPFQENTLCREGGGDRRRRSGGDGFEIDMGGQVCKAGFGHRVHELMRAHSLERIAL